MRHRRKKGRLNRRTSWRRATLKSLARDLFKYQRIETTMAKAKALRAEAEPLITLAKSGVDPVSARRQAFQELCDKDAVRNLFDNIAPLYRNMQGGYTRIMPVGARKGDGACMVIMELTRRTVSDEELLGTGEKKAKAGKKIKEKKVKTEEAAIAPAGEKKPAEKAHAAPEVKIEEKEKRAVEDIKKEKAKIEQKKIRKRGIFKIFRRKSMG